MKIEIGDANLVSVIVRKLKPGKTFEQFREAWYPEKGFGFPVRVINAINENDPEEIISIGLMKLPEYSINETMQRISEQESVRHDRIDEVIRETKLKGIYKIVSDDDLSGI